MTYVVTAACINCKYTDCVEVCPVDAFVEGQNFLAIDPELCVDCHLCVPECPVDAIYPEEEVPADQQHYTLLNEELAKEWEPITEVKDPPADADEWANIPPADKEGKLIR